MAKTYIERLKAQRALASAKRILTALGTGAYCGASGMPCDRAGDDCCVHDHLSEPSLFEAKRFTNPARDLGER